MLSCPHQPGKSACDSSSEPPEPLTTSHQPPQLRYQAPELTTSPKIEPPPVQINHRNQPARTSAPIFSTENTPKKHTKNANPKTHPTHPQNPPRGWATLPGWCPRPTRPASPAPCGAPPGATPSRRPAWPHRGRSGGGGCSKPGRSPQTLLPSLPLTWHLTRGPCNSKMICQVPSHRCYVSGREGICLRFLIFSCSPLGFKGDLSLEKCFICFQGLKQMEEQWAVFLRLSFQGKMLKMVPSKKDTPK